MARFRKNPEQSPETRTVSPCDRRDVPKEAQDPYIGGRRDEGSRKSSPIVLDAAKMHFLQKNQYWLTRIVFLRSLGFVYGWESQLLETGFLAIFFCPIWTWKQLPRGTPPSPVVIWGYRWLLFRIMLGAGLIKVRGDKCWWELTCMMYHYETQPVPNPLSYYLHQTPPFLHKLEVLGNHIIELIVPWFMLLTRPFRIACGIIQISFQVILIMSGNLSFLNWLTILPSIPYFDDAALKWMFSKNASNQVALLAKEAGEQKVKHSMPLLGKGRKATNMALALCLGFLSIPVVINLVSPNQQMNTSFEPLRLVNTYGAFGSITKSRREVIIQGTHSLDPHNRSAVWEEYEFFCKPGNVFRRPCVISPYHYRLDWLMWFAGFQDYQSHPWLFHFVAKLLVNDKNVSKIILKNPFMDREPPRYIRAEHYHYRYAPVGSSQARAGQWWIRSRVGSYMYPVSLSSLKPLLKTFGWEMPSM
ncbi:lipase maturation factor 1-like isoform X1 [Dermacentor variabilis]|uniref:lipase maturation factor 1-like isoform X1 n=1 Tax=Dermacentor variabilis TaxID=34621 RepID=UPI003F5C6C84